MNDLQITFRRDQATNVNAAMDEVFTILPDHYPSLLVEDNEKWIFGLKWPTSPSWYVDPSLFKVAEDLYGLQVEEIAPFYQIEKLNTVDIVFSMFHSRAIIAASLACRRKSQAPNYIIHIDAHDDLMPILVYPTENPHAYYSSLFEESIDIYKPSSIITAIDQGIIHKGNFLSLYLLMTPPGKLIYVNDSCQETTAWLTGVSTDRNFAGSKLFQMELIFQNHFTAKGWHFHQTNFLPKNLVLTATDSIWLDIDLDYFCNRYDGDSDRSNQIATPVEQKDVNQKVNKFLDEISRVNWLNKVEAISIATSPSFFPSEYWAEVTPRIFNVIKQFLA